MKDLFASLGLSLEIFLFTWVILGENLVPSSDVISVLPYLFLLFLGSEILKMSVPQMGGSNLVPLVVVQGVLLSLIHSSVISVGLKFGIGALMISLIYLVKARSGKDGPSRSNVVPMLLVGSVISALLVAHGNLKLGLAQANFTLAYVALFAIGMPMPRTTWMIGTLLHLQLAYLFGSFSFTTLIMIVLCFPMLSCKEWQPSRKWQINLGPLVSAFLAAFLFLSCSLQPSYKKGQDLDGPSAPEKSSPGDQTSLNESTVPLEVDAPVTTQGLRIHILNGHLIKSLAKKVEIRVSLLSTDAANVTYKPESAQVITEPLKEGYLAMEFDSPGSRFLTLAFQSASSQILGTAELAFHYDTAGKPIDIPAQVKIDPNLEIKVHLDLGFRFHYQGAAIEKTTYLRNIKPLVIKHCQPCHNGANFGVLGNSFGTVDYESWPFRYPDDPLYYPTLEDFVRASRDLMYPGAERMPPIGGPVPPVSKSDIDMFSEWLNTGMPEAPEFRDHVKSLLGPVELRLHNLSQGTVTELGRSELTLKAESPSHLDLKLEDLNFAFHYELEFIAWNPSQDQILKSSRMTLDLNHPSALIDIELAE